MLTYAHVCSRMLTYAHVRWRMLAYAGVCWRMLTYADVCSVCSAADVQQTLLKLQQAMPALKDMSPAEVAKVLQKQPLIEP
jgi:hypothetical protein